MEKMSHLFNCYISVPSENLAPRTLTDLSPPLQPPLQPHYATTTTATTEPPQPPNHRCNRIHNCNRRCNRHRCNRCRCLCYYHDRTLPTGTFNGITFFPCAFLLSIVSLCGVPLLLPVMWKTDVSMIFKVFMPVGTAIFSDTFLLSNSLPLHQTPWI